MPDSAGEAAVRRSSHIQAPDGEILPPPVPRRPPPSSPEPSVGPSRAQLRTMRAILIPSALIAVGGWVAFGVTLAVLAGQAFPFDGCIDWTGLG